MSLTTDRLSDDVLNNHRRLARRLSYRGSDGSGEFVSPETKAALFSNQFKITAFERNDQPILSPDGTVAVCINGEIYNYRELSRRCGDSGGVPECDIAVLPGLFRRFRLNAFELIEGMFAIALYDCTARTLILARDRFGEKPLFYAVYGGCVHFASEACVLQSILPGDLDPQSLSEYLAMGFCRNHLVRRIIRVEPGTMVTIGDDGIRTHRYWSPDLTPDYSRSISDTLDLAASTLTSVIDLMRPEKVNSGIFASGGLDSAIITRIVDRKYGIPIVTSGLAGVKLRSSGARTDSDYSGVESEGNELPYADELASGRTAEYRRRTFSARDLETHLQAMIDHLPGGPVVSTSFPLIHFSTLAATNLRVCFSGEGSDELHAGYATCQPDHYGPSIAKSFMEQTDLFERSELALLLGPESADLIEESCLRIDAELSSESLAEGADIDSRFNKIRWFMLNYVMNRHILEKGDGMTMGFGPVELRMPYLNPRYATFALTLPYEICMLHGRRKGFLFDVAARLGVPEMILQRQQKQRTSLPYYSLIFEDQSFGRFARATLNSGSILSQVLNIKDIATVAFGNPGVRNAEKRAWSLLILEIWLQTHFGAR